MTGLRWRPEIDALAFRPAGHDADCVMHRLAFRALTGRAEPSSADCTEAFAAREADFARAACAKIARSGIAPGAAFHLTSRDVARAAASPVPTGRPLDPRPAGS